MRESSSPRRPRFRIPHRTTSHIELARPGSSNISVVTGATGGGRGKLLPGDVVSMGTAVGGDLDEPAAPHIPGVTRANLVGFDGAMKVSISRLGALSNPISTS